MNTEREMISVLELKRRRKVKWTRKAELDLNFSNCQSFNVLPKFVCVDLPNVSRHDITSIRKSLLKSAITKRSKESRKRNCDRRGTRYRTRSKRC